MTTRSYLRGHPIEFLNGQWVYSDTKEPTVETHEGRPCGHCNLPNTPEDHDACLGTLPGVMNACCGHGRLNEAYVQLMDNSVVRGDDAVTMIDILKRNRGDNNA